MEWYEKKDNSKLELREYEDWLKGQEMPMDAESSAMFLQGMLSNIGFHKHLQVPIYEDDTFFFPFLDKYFPHDGRVYISRKDVQDMKLMTFRRKVADCLKVADKMGGVFELRKIIDYERKPILTNWLRLGGEL